MVDRGLHFLNAGNVVAVHHDGKISQALALDLAAVVAEQRNGQQIPLPRFFQRSNDVPRSAAGGVAAGWGACIAIAARTRAAFTAADSVATS